MTINEVQALELLSGDRDLLKQLATIFVEDSLPLVDVFEQAIDLRDAKKAGLAIHSLKGITATFFAEPEVSLFASVEMAANHLDWSRLDCARHEVRVAVIQIVREMFKRSLVESD
ncbi:MAG: Hpt domain-containing protein [Planctomycetota bacterium]|nr:Hpt domain-containing protein [Planctomycetota bacterium]